MKFIQLIKDQIPIVVVGVMATTFMMSCVEDTRPTFVETYQNRRYDQPIDVGPLWYDLSKFVKDYQDAYGTFPWDDINDFVKYHSMPYVGEAATNLSGILNKDNLDVSFNDGYGPEVFFRYSSSRTRNSYDIIYDKYDVDLCENKVIKNAPTARGSVDQLIVEYSFHTIKTRGGVMVKWAGNQVISYYPDSLGTIKIVEKTGSISHPYNFITTGSSRGQIGGRGGSSGPYLDNNKEVNPLIQPDNPEDEPVADFELVSNLIPIDMEIGQYEVIESPVKCCVPDVLQQPVCRGGQLVQDVKWEAPVLLNVNKISE